MFLELVYEALQQMDEDEMRMTLSHMSREELEMINEYADQVRALESGEYEDDNDIELDDLEYTDFNEEDAMESLMNLPIDEFNNTIDSMTTKEILDINSKLDQYMN